jgi:hypothetical protein cdivTM_06112
MGVEFKYPWRLIDKRGNVVADGMSPYADNAGDWVLQDDNTWLNYETGERASGNIGLLDKDGNLVEDNEEHNLSKSGKGNDPRAFGEIRSNLGSGVSPAFEQAVHTDKPKIENPNEPTPESPSPSGNGVPGGSLIGEISKQNKILQNLVSKMGSSNNARKISGAISSLSSSLKSSIDRVSDGLKEVSKNNGANISLAIGSLNQNLAKISDSNKGRFDIEKERHTYEKTPQSIKDLDGETVAKMSPRDAQTVKNVSEARVATDENNFSLSDNDISGLFPEFPDITTLFDFPLPNKIDLEVLKNG